jgi:NlpC/P60 family putative phage cell wall peptidase
MGIDSFAPPPRAATPTLAARGPSDDIVAIARSWIGTPYVHQASVKGAGSDCLGLLRGVWRELHGAEPEAAPPYSPDWAEATGEETLYKALARHLSEIELSALAPGDIALFRMARTGPAKHCGVVGDRVLLDATALLERNPLGATASLFERRLTLIHARQNKRVSEEAFTEFWRRKLAYAFRI